MSFRTDETPTALARDGEHLERLVGEPVDPEIADQIATLVERIARRVTWLDRSKRDADPRKWAEAQNALRDDYARLELLTGQEATR